MPKTAEGRDLPAAPKTLYQLFVVYQEPQAGGPGHPADETGIGANPVPELAERWELLADAQVLAASGEQAIKTYVKSIHAERVKATSDRIWGRNEPEYQRYVAVPARNITTLKPSVKLEPQLAFG